VGKYLELILGCTAQFDFGEENHPYIQNQL